jgi:hypothetical protein
MKEILELYLKYVPLHCRKHETGDIDNPPILTVEPLPEPLVLISADFFSHSGTIDEMVEKLKEAIATNTPLENQHG